MRVWQSKTAGLDREWVLVGLMAVTAAMSAFAFWQATTFGDEAAERRAQERVAVAEVERNNGALRAQVDFDLRVDTAYCAAAAERDATLVDALVAPTDELAPLVSPLVAGNLEARSLGRLTQADLTTGCGTNGDDNAYKTESAVAWAAADAPEFQRGGPAGRAQDVAGPDRAEHRLMVAAVAFAVGLLLLTAIDLTTVHERTRGTEPSSRSSRWRRIWAGLAVPALA